MPLIEYQTDDPRSGEYRSIYCMHIDTHWMRRGTIRVSHASTAFWPTFSFSATYGHLMFRTARRALVQPDGCCLSSLCVRMACKSGQCVVPFHFVYQPIMLRLGCLHIVISAISACRFCSVASLTIRSSI